MKTLKAIIVFACIAIASTSVQAQFGKGGTDKPVTKPDTGVSNPSQETETPAPTPKPTTKPTTKPDTGTTVPDTGDQSQETAPTPKPRPQTAPAQETQTTETPKGKKGPSAATIHKAEQNSNGHAFSGKGKGGDKNTMDPVIKDKNKKDHMTKDKKDKGIKKAHDSKSQKK